MNVDNPHDGRCLFFELSAELRNEIYELALVESDSIEVTKENVAQPGLLRTCRQTRAEAIRIYYMQNKFSFTLHRLDASLLRAFHKQNPAQMWKGGKGMTVTDDWNLNDACWPNFLQWVKWYHSDEVACITCPEECGGGLCCALDAAFLMVDEMKQNDWQQVFSVLQIFKKVLPTQRGPQPRWIETTEV